MIPHSVNKWLIDSNGRPNFPQLPPNVAATLPEETQKKIVSYVLRNYAWPQIQERLPFEPTWDRLHKLAKATLSKDQINALDSSILNRRKEETRKPLDSAVRVGDTVIHDAVERLSDLTHFVSFKEDFPVQFNLPDYYSDDKSSTFYHPFEDKIKAGNALLHWNAKEEDVYTKYLPLSRHFYTYGIAFAHAEFVFNLEMVGRRTPENPNQITPTPEITRIGTTFEPINIRKLWLNWRLPINKMKLQPCPFFFSEFPRFATLQNRYDPLSNPTGFVNLDKLQSNQWLYSGPEFNATIKAFEDAGGSEGRPSVQNLLRPEHSVEALWTLYPMLPLDEQGNFDEDGKLGLPHQRYTMNLFGAGLQQGNLALVRLQENFEPQKNLPIFGSCHMPDLDSGLYSPAIGEILMHHYIEIVTCMEQYFANKDWINEPPSWVTQGSPAQEQDLNRAGAKILVNGPNDFGWRQPYDATQSTANIMTYLREAAQTSSKAVDAILGKAMGGRTSATEAQNAFEAAMSGITTPINIFNRDIFGTWAERVWDNCALRFDADLLKSLTGSFGFAMTPSEMALRPAVKFDSGSSYVENIVRQQNLRYILESSAGDPSIDRAEFWRMLFKVMNLPEGKLVLDGGLRLEVTKATDQAIRTYLGEQVMVSPTQNHNIAIEVKTAFLEDLESHWNKSHPQNAPLLVQQIELHMQFAMLQQKTALAAAESQIPPSLPSETQTQN